MSENVIVLGCRARDIVSGFEGIVTGKSDYMNGCVQWCLSPQIDEKGKHVSGNWFDSQQLEYVDSGIVAKLAAIASPLAIVRGEPGGEDVADQEAEPVVEVPVSRVRTGGPVENPPPIG